MCNLTEDRRDTPDADAPEIEITPAMISAGIEFMESTALNTFTESVMKPEFIEAFIRAVIPGASLREDVLSDAKPNGSCPRSADDNPQ